MSIDFLDCIHIAYDFFYLHTIFILIFLIFSWLCRNFDVYLWYKVVSKDDGIHCLLTYFITNFRYHVIIFAFVPFRDYRGRKIRRQLV